MSESSLLAHTAGHITRLTLNAPERRNALDYATVQDLIAALRQAEADPEVRVVILQAAGDNFSAGGDLREFRTELDQPAQHHWEKGGEWEELFALVPAMTKPVIAAVQGYALAGGCGLVALADIAIAAEDAQLGVTEIRIGLFPLLILPALRRAVGMKQAVELSLTGRIIGAAEAARIGLVNRVVPKEDLEPAVTVLAEELAGKGPNALRLGKHCLYATADMSYDDALAFARSLRVAFMLGDDLREGTTAFLEKRKPNWG